MSAEKLKRTSQPSLDVRLPSKSPSVVAPSAVLMAMFAAERGITADASAFESVEQSVAPKRAEPATLAIGIHTVFEAASTTPTQPFACGAAGQGPAGCRDFLVVDAA